MNEKMQSATRRHFIGASGAVAAAFTTGCTTLALRRKLGPNAKMQHAAVGVQGMGKNDIHNIASHPNVEISVLCDIDANHLKQAAAKYPNARTYRDWREMLETEGDRIDSLSVTVPDHMHAPIALSAMKRGKHIYCQKPLTHEIGEARQMANTAAGYGCITQMGNHIHSAIEYRLAVALIKAGVIGKVKEVHSWVNAKYPQPPRPQRVDAVPAHVNWDDWLGVAPARPYLKDVYHPFHWRCWQDFGTGAIGDFGCHILDPVFSALDLTAPLSVRAEVAQEWISNDSRFIDSWPDWEVLHYRFPGTSYTAGRVLPVTWYDSGKQPPAELAQLPPGRKLASSGSLFIGEGGVMMLPHVGGPQLFPEARFKGYKRPKLPRNVDHYHTWVDHCFSGVPTSDGFHYAGPLTEAVLLGTVANRLPGITLEWDSHKLRFGNSATANAIAAYKYRYGWGVV
jgi:predicted dehydrogenase